MDSAPPPTHAIVLAAGNSRRMGSPKALLKFGGLTALELYVSRLREAGVAGVTVVYGLNDAVAQEAARLQCDCVSNHSPDDGRTRSLQIALLQFIARPVPVAHAFLLSPVDCPLVGVAALRAILGAPSNVKIVRPVFRAGELLRGGHPVRIALSLADRILQLKPDQSLRDFVHSESTVREDLEVNDPEILSNLDTVEQYESALVRFRRGAL